MTEHTHTNSLINETSPYLLQHAHNPVNWYAWGDEALKKSKKEDKPILVSIGYSACHWCHVMERESFEDEATAQLMNEHFINIKIDREERPDLDHIYMDAVQAITGSGGWPLNVFLTPDMKPFYGGTYFPPVRAFNRSSWKEVLVAVVRAYKEKRNEIMSQAQTLIQHLLNANDFNAGNGAGSADHQITNNIAKTLTEHVDKEWGGFGQAPKFPQTFSIIYLLRHYYLTGNNPSKNAALLSLDRMMEGGIYDHLGGGFCRYATDRHWQIPHFEKMLYDNALLINAFVEAYQLTKKKEYADIVKQTVEFIKREMTSPEGGFYSALDADSEGVEGKYYTWSKKEVDDLLGEYGNLFCRCYDVSEPGNWEHANILWIPESLEKISVELGIGEDELVQKLNELKQILFNARQLRTRPSLDNKILTSWNALMVVGLCKAYGALGKSEYLESAKMNIVFLERHLFIGKVNLLHSWNKIANQQQAFLDDYAALILAYIFLHQSTADSAYLLKARDLLEVVLKIFSDEEGIYFYYTAIDQADIPMRKIEMYDGATPSGNSLMATNLIILSVYFDMPFWRKRAEHMILNAGKFAEKYPTSFSVWGLDLQLLVHGLKEIVIMGEDCNRILLRVLNEYIPLKVTQASATENEEWPLMREKLITQNRTNIYICENYKCLKPFTNFIEFKNHLPEHF